MSMFVRGSIFFSSKLNTTEINNLAFNIINIATNLNLGIFLGAITSIEKEEEETIALPAVSNRHIQYVISESAYYNNCDKLFEPIYVYEDKRVNLSQSGLPRIQVLLENILLNKDVAYIDIHIGTDDGTILTTKQECEVSKFCDVIANNMTRNNSFVPRIYIKVVN